MIILLTQNCAGMSNDTLNAQEVKRALTIIAGFKCMDGIVICADSQETIGSSKRSVPKLQLHRGPFPDFQMEGLVNHDLAVVFAGAGDGPFIDKIAELAWQPIRNASDIWEASAAIESVIKETYKEYGQIYQQGQCPSAELIYGITMGRTSKLFYAYGPIVNEKDFVSAGIGYYLADFLAGRMYQQHLSTRQCVILAAYILDQAKEHVEGCGGDSQIAVLREEEPSGLVEYKLIEEVTKFLQFADRELGGLLMNSANFSAPPDNLGKEFSATLEALSTFRDHHKGEVEKHREWWREMPIMLGIQVERDDLGIETSITMPSDSQTTED